MLVPWYMQWLGNFSGTSRVSMLVVLTQCCCSWCCVYIAQDNQFICSNEVLRLRFFLPFRLQQFRVFWWHHHAHMRTTHNRHIGPWAGVCLLAEASVMLSRKQPIWLKDLITFSSLIMLLRTTYWDDLGLKLSSEGTNANSWPLTHAPLTRNMACWISLHLF